VRRSGGHLPTVRALVTGVLMLLTLVAGARGSLLFVDLLDKPLLMAAILAAALLTVAFAGTTLQFYDLRRRAASSAADLSDEPVAAS
jgi:hypothetical protein